MVPGGAPAGGNGVFPGVVVMIDTPRAVHYCESPALGPVRADVTRNLAVGEAQTLTIRQ